jgi:hypothetical protein
VVRVTLSLRLAKLGSEAVAFWTQQRIARVPQVGQLHHHFALVGGRSDSCAEVPDGGEPCGHKSDQPLGRDLQRAGRLTRLFHKYTNELSAARRFVLAARIFNNLLTSDRKLEYMSMSIYLLDLSRETPGAGCPATALLGYRWETR